MIMCYSVVTFSIPSDSFLPEIPVEQYTFIFISEIKYILAVLHFSDITYPLMTMMAGTLMLLLTISKDNYIYFIIHVFFVE